MKFIYLNVRSLYLILLVAFCSITTLFAGDLIWEKEFGSRSRAIALSGSDEQEKVLLGFDNGMIYCISTLTDFFNPLWDYNTEGKVIGIACGESGNIYFSSVGETNIVGCLNKNGNLLWETNIPFDPWGLCLSKNEQKIFFLSNNGYVTCIDRYGTPAWMKPIKGIDTPKINGWGLETDGTEKIFVTTYDGQLICFDYYGEIIKKELIDKNKSKLKGVALDSNNNIFCGGENHLYFLDRGTLTKYKTQGRVRSIFSDGSNYVYISCDDGHIYMIQCTTSLFWGPSFAIKDTFLPDLSQPQQVYKVVASSKKRAFFSDEIKFYCVDMSNSR